MAGTLVLERQAVIQGDVVATPGAADVLILAGPGPGTLTGLGSRVTGFDDTNVNRHANWTLAGPATLTAGEHLQDHGSLTLGGATSGAGKITLEGGAVLTTTAGVTGVGVAFNGGATAVLDSVASFSSTISGFGHGDTIDLANLRVSSVKYLNGTLTLKDGSATVGSLAFSADLTQGNFSVGADGHGGSDITYMTASASPPLADDFSLGRHGPGLPVGAARDLASLHGPPTDWTEAFGGLHAIAAV